MRALPEATLEWGELALLVAECPVHHGAEPAVASHGPGAALKVLRLVDREPCALWYIAMRTVHRNQCTSLNYPCDVLRAYEYISEPTTSATTIETSSPDVLYIYNIIIRAYAAMD